MGGFNPGLEIGNLTVPYSPTAEVKAVLDGFPASGDEIRMFYFNLRQDGTTVDPSGFALVPKTMSATDKAAGYVNAVFLNVKALAQQSPFWTSPHELLHILINGTHASGNIDFSIEFGKDIMLWKAPTATTNTLGATKRISEDQESAARNYPHP